MNRDTVRQVALLGPILAGLCASTILLVDYLRPAPVFCGLETGCDVVKGTTLAWIGPVPTPALGMAAFLLLGVLASARGPWARGLMLAVTSLGAAGAAFLIWVQTVIHAFCKYCMVADSMLVLLLLLATWRFWGKWDLPSAPKPRKIVAGSFALTMAAPLSLSFVMKPDVPEVIREEMSKTPRGKVTVVDFVDFQCPHCRRAHGEIGPILESHKDQVRVVRHHVPLTKIHHQAMHAARAACCAEQLGKGDAMAEALFSSDDLSPDACEKLASKVGVDVEAYRKCVSDPATDDRIHKDGDLFKAAHGHGLPTIWIDEQRVEGAQPAKIYEDAITSAAGRRKS
jgi:protein-disulfide isomerase